MQVAVREFSGYKQVRKVGTTTLPNPKDVLQFIKRFGSMTAFMDRTKVSFAPLCRLVSLLERQGQTLFELASTWSGTSKRNNQAIMARLLAKGLVYRSPDNRYYLTETAIKELSSLL